MSGNWLDLSNSSNRYIRMYVKGFVDVSGGNVRLRGKNDNLLVDQGDTSFNTGNVFVGNVLTCSGGVVVKNNLNMVGLINQSNVTLSGGYIYKEIVSDAINNNITTLTNTVNTLSTNLVANTNAGSVTLGSGANVFLGNVTNNTTVNSLKLVTLGDASINGSVAINGNVSINKDLNVTGNLSVNQYQTKQTITTLNYQLQVVEDLSINGRLFLNGNASVTGLTTTGSVGIGTDNPQATLDVNGNVLLSTIRFSYTNLPTFSSNNIGYTITKDITGATNGNNSFPGINMLLGGYMPLSIGVWMITGNITFSTSISTGYIINMFSQSSAPDGNSVPIVSHVIYQSASTHDNRSISAVVSTIGTNIYLYHYPTSGNVGIITVGGAGNHQRCTNKLYAVRIA